MFELLGFGDKSERAQKVFALDYCSGAFVTEGVFAYPHSDVYYSPFAAHGWEAILICRPGGR
jgi:hypothetical protein